jgi:hypothetical protein
MSPTKATKKPAAPVAGSAAKSAARGAASKPADPKPPARRAPPPPSKAVAAPPAPSAPESDAPPPDPVGPLSSVDPSSEPAAEAKREKAPSAVQALAMELAQSADAAAVQRHAAGLEDERETVANQAARLIQELSELKPELLVPLIDRFGKLLVAKNRRVVASAGAALAPLSRIAPAKVAKQLPVLTQYWELTTEEGKDGLVRTFAGLCTASVAYQKRLEPALARALGEADPKLLVRWTEIVLPALKGEPHARARAVVEERLPQIPRPIAQKIADFLGIKLRPIPR